MLVIRGNYSFSHQDQEFWERYIEVAIEVVAMPLHDWGDLEFTYERQQIEGYHGDGGLVPPKWRKDDA